MDPKVLSNSRFIQPSTHQSPNLGIPNVCKMPGSMSPAPIPIPYANMVDAQAEAGDEGARQKQKQIKEETDGAESATQSAILRKARGDAAGSQGMLVSFAGNGRAETLLYSSKVKIEGKEVAHMGRWYSNNQ